MYKRENTEKTVKQNLKMSSMYNIEKLDDSNYDSWCVLARSVLVHQNLWGIVSNELVKPEDEYSEEFKTWKRENEKAMAVLFLSLNASQINCVKNCTTANDIWNELEKLHRPSGPVRKVTLFKQLLNKRMVEGENVQTHIMEFSNIVENLAAIDISLQEELIVIMLLASLPNSYENLVVALEARDELPSLSVIKCKLAEENERRKGNESKEGAQSFSARHLGQGERGRRNNATTDKRRDFKCYKCGQKGHYAANCTSKKEYENDGKGERGKNNARNDHKETAQRSFVGVAGCCRMSVDTWVIDSGATSHMCTRRELFVQYEQHEETIELAAKNYTTAIGKGTVLINSLCGFEITLKEVLFVPGLQCNFISVGKVVANRCSVRFDPEYANIYDSKNIMIMKAKKVSGLFLCETKSQEKLCISKAADNIMLWHERYGHLNVQSLQELKCKEMVRGLTLNSKEANLNCINCMKNKCHVKPFEKSQTRAGEMLELIHSDVCGPFNIISNGGSRYFMTMIDDKSRYIHVYFMKHKSEVTKIFKQHVTMVERQKDRKVKAIRSDNGTEYVNKEFDEYLRVLGIKRQLTVPYTPQQNGVAERCNRTIVEMARAMVNSAGLKESFWAEAVACAAYLRNRSPTKALEGKTPFEMFTGHKPVVKHLKVFGCIAIAMEKGPKKKFQEKGKEYVMVGYSESSKAYRLYDKSTGDVKISRDVYFVENIVPISKESASATIMLEDENDEQDIMAEDDSVQDIDDDIQDEIEDDVVVNEAPKRGPGRPKMIRTGLRGRPAKQYNVLNIMLANNMIVPLTAQQAQACPQAEQWKLAMDEEYDALIKNDTWDLVKLPSGLKPIGCKWVFTLKTNPAGEVERFKARLVAKGCCQKYGVDYEETYSPVVRYATIRMILAMAAEYELYVHQLDVSTAYLNGSLEEEIFMQQPELYDDKSGYVLKLKKSLYGLKQAGRVWNTKLDSVLTKMGYRACESEACLYTKCTQEKTINVIAVYVDDLLLACSDKGEMLATKRAICSEFQVVDKGPATNFLGLEIQRDGDIGAIRISQKKHIMGLLQEMDMVNCRTASTPLEANFQVNCESKSCKRVDATEYQSVIGSLMYIALCSRPDVLHSVCKLSQRNTNPHSEHLAAAKQVLRYLNTTADLALIYEKSGQQISGYADADWAGDSTDRKSFTGYAFMWGGSVFSWTSRKQKSVALSSTEAEYMALSDAAKEAIYLSKLISEMRLYFKLDCVTMHGDNVGALNLVKNPVYHARSKHIDVKYHHVRNCYEENLINLKYCPTNEMIADILTKNLSKINHTKCTALLGLK